MTSRDIIETQSVEALERLFEVANGHSEQCKYIAAFLLSLYNGTRFPFDLTDLRAIDDAHFEDCMTVLRMDSRLHRQEVHHFFPQGGKRFEELADVWRIEDVQRTCEDAKRAAQPEGTLAPLHDGGTFDAKLLTYGEAPGYRDVTIAVTIGEGNNTRLDLRLSPSDGEAVMAHIARVHALAWRKAERGPLDAKPSEKRPAWLDVAPSTRAGY